eukprot:15644-Heterococcus_DN1.PRE.1
MKSQNCTIPQRLRYVLALRRRSSTLVLLLAVTYVFVCVYYVLLSFSATHVTALLWPIASAQQYISAAKLPVSHQITSTAAVVLHVGKAVAHCSVGQIGAVMQSITQSSRQDDCNSQRLQLGIVIALAAHCNCAAAT